MNAPFRSRSLPLLTLAAALLAGCGGGGSHGSSGAGSGTGPSISAQPASVTAAVGGTVSFSVTASGAGNVAYQWAKDGVAIAGATGSTYTIASVTSADVGAYACLVTDGKGTTTSASATLTLAGAPTITKQPQNLTVTVGGQASFHVVASGTGTLTYQWSKDGTAIPGATSATYTLASVAADSAGSYTVAVTNASGTTQSSAATLTLGLASAPVITNQPYSKTVALGQEATFSVTAKGTGTLAYQWTKDGAAIPGATSSSYVIAKTTAASAGDYNVKVTNVSGTSTSASATLTVVTAPVITSEPTSATVDPGQPVAFTVVATGTDLRYQWYKGLTAIPGATSPTYSIPSVSPSDAARYRVAVTNEAGPVYSQYVSLTVVSAPTITTQPSGTTVGVGSAATFAVTASSPEPIAYQWYKNGTKIDGATAASYTTPVAVYNTDNGAKFTVTLTNGGGTTTSDAAVLTVDEKPVITTQPASVSVVAGKTATFTVAATASGAITYQWYRIEPGATTGVAISKATDASYTTPATTVAKDNGAKYYVTVKNDNVIGTQSATATLTVTSS